MTAARSAMTSAVVGAVVGVCVMAAYAIGVLNERWFPGDRTLPAAPGEALLWLVCFGLCSIAAVAARR